MPCKPYEINWELLHKSSNGWKPSWDLSTINEDRVDKLERSLINLANEVRELSGKIQEIKESGMKELTVEQRLDSLYELIREGTFEIERPNYSGVVTRRELIIRDCPICKHETLQVRRSRNVHDNNIFLCLTCGHSLTVGMVSID